MNKKFFASLVTLLAIGCACVFAEDAETTKNAATGIAGSIKYIAAALAVGIACISGGTAVAKIGSAAMGAMSENAELS